MCQKSPNSPNCSLDVNLNFFQTSDLVTSNHPPLHHRIRPSHGELRKFLVTLNPPLHLPRIGPSHGELQQRFRRLVCVR